MLVKVHDENGCFRITIPKGYAIEHGINKKGTMIDLKEDERNRLILTPMEDRK